MSLLGPYHPRTQTLEGKICHQSRAIGLQTSRNASHHDVNLIMGCSPGSWRHCYIVTIHHRHHPGCATRLTDVLFRVIGRAFAMRDRHPGMFCSSTCLVMARMRIEIEIGGVLVPWPLVFVWLGCFQLCCPC